MRGMLNGDLYSGICMCLVLMHMSRWMDCASSWQTSGCIGLLSVSLPKLFDVVCPLCAGDVTMTDE